MIHGATVLTGGFLTDKTIETVTNLVCDPLFQNNEQQADNISVVDQLNAEIKNLIKDVLENYNSQKKEGIIFFIDNLDRIDPKLAVEILETTNNVFSFKDSKCVFTEIPRRLYDSRPSIQQNLIYKRFVKVLRS